MRPDLRETMWIGGGGSGSGWRGAGDGLRSNEG